MYIPALNAHRHFNRPTRLEMPARPMAVVGDFQPITTQRYTQYETLSQGVTAPKITKFLHDVAASSPMFLPLCRWRFCIPFQNASAKTGGSKIQHLQKRPKLIGYHSNVP